MSDLTAIWTAELQDGTEIKQFDEHGENKYQLVLDRCTELKYFHLFNWSVNIRFTVDLQKGLIHYHNNGKSSTSPYISEEALAIPKYNIRLIYFRRNFIHGIGSKVTKKETFYFLGYQYSDLLGINRKVILQIDKDGNFVIGE